MQTFKISTIDSVIDYYVLLSYRIINGLINIHDISDLLIEILEYVLLKTFLKPLV